ncbi:MAG: acetyl-CoA carboxylase, carboxyltransferase subunit beta [Alphaproteobacteria bacterium]
MNWISNYVRPKIRALVSPKEVPENLWLKCPGCGTMLFQKDLEQNWQVCQHCGHHMRLSARERLKLLFGEEGFELIPLPKIAPDPLKFRDVKRYTDRLKEAQQKSGQQDAIMVARGQINGLPVVAAVFDFSFMGGSMGIAVGEGIVTAARLAVSSRSAFIAVPASGGARMQEGAFSLMQMPRSVVAVRMVKEAGLPYLVLFTDPTTGGVSASFAMLGDIHLAEPGAQICFAGARVIEGTIRETLPAGFQSAEFLLDHGMVDMVTPRHRQRQTIASILGMLMKPSIPQATSNLPVSIENDHMARFVAGAE